MARPSPGGYNVVRLTLAPPEPAAPEPAAPALEPRPAWRLDGLTPSRCRWSLAGLLGFGVVAHVLYLTVNCPLDLSGDEAHYWDWSRQLGLSYYSKGPVVAYLIRASCGVFGDAMWAVRLPAVALAAASGVLTYAVTRRLFGSDRLALGATALGAAVPVFAAGSLLMTIDAPFYACWAGATLLATYALFDGKRWAWPAMGVVVGVGFLAKYAMFLWPIGPALFVLLDRRARRAVWGAGVLIAVSIALACTVPVVAYNARHGWVSLRHVAKQTGVAGVDPSPWYAPLAGLGEMVGGQAAVLGPVLAGLMAIAVWRGIRLARAGEGAVGADAAPAGRDARAAKFLLCVGLPMLAIVAATSLRTKVQANWPVPAYFTLLILTAWFLATRLRDAATWRPYRAWFWAGVVGFGVVGTVLAHHSEWLYPPVARLNAALGTNLQPRRFDPANRLRGWAELGDAVGGELGALGPGAFVLCADYQTTGLMAFYVPGQPVTYCAGSYFTEDRKRYSQYDLWANRDLDRPALRGRDAVYVGYKSRDVERAFDSVDRVREVRIEVGGLTVRRFTLWRCRGFRGMTRPATDGSY